MLEIGCGWGSFALMAAREYGARVTGVTLSQQQLELARERVAAAGLADRVEIRLQDYRTLEGQFSKIASIEMLEAIGYAQYPTFFAACDRLLAPGGLAAIQVIGMPDQRFERYRRKEDWIQRYIFPGSLLPSLEALQTAMSRASGLMVRRARGDRAALRGHAEGWRERFFASLPAVRALGFDDRFIRTWDFYLASCEALFRTRAIRDMQLVLGRPFEEPRIEPGVKIRTVRERTSIPSQLAGIVAVVVPPLGLVAAVWLLWDRGVRPVDLVLLAGRSEPRRRRAAGSAAPAGARATRSTRSRSRPPRQPGRRSRTRPRSPHLQ